MDNKKKLHDCINLARKLPPVNLERNVTAITNLIYDDDDLLNEFSQKADHLCEVCNDDGVGPFLQTEYNRDGDSYRSPNNNQYYPPTEDAMYPDENLRELEVKMNKAFKAYTNMYYSNAAICSVYLWDTNDNIEDGFAGSIFIKNNVKAQKELTHGGWDSTNLIDIKFTGYKEGLIMATYKLTTSVIIQMHFSSSTKVTKDDINLSGTITKSIEETGTCKNHLSAADHIEKIGTMVEEMETRIRIIIEELYFKKTKQILNTSRLNPEDNNTMEKSSKLRDVIKQDLNHK